jgi:glutamine synthetase
LATDAQLALEAIAQRIWDEHGYHVHCCAEIEFAFASSAPIPQGFFDALAAQAKAANASLRDFAKEQMANSAVQQYEARFTHTDPSSAARDLAWFQRALPEVASQFGLHLLDAEASHAQGVYSGLHWHLHLTDAQGNYCFFKQDDEMSPPLEHSLAGLLTSMPAMMRYFAPNESSFLRLSSGADHIPTSASWGGNNRTCALRLPESVVPHRHIEHRVCGADADATQSLRAILVGLHYGLTRKPALPPQCFGNANKSDDYARLPMNSAEAQLACDAAQWMRDYA